MAVIWQHEDGDTKYEVRSAGTSLRLYTNGAFHSQHSEKHLFTGAIWDLLSIPTCFVRATAPRSVLMLGVGGGAAIHQIDKLIATEQIVGIEFNPIHIQIAKEIFKITGDHIKLVEADARVWIAQHHSQFDVVIDDLFIDAADDPERPFILDRQWQDSLARTVGQYGLLIQNHLSQSAATAAAEQLKDHFASALFFTVPQYENVVLAAYRQPIERRSASRFFEQMLKTKHPGALRKLRYRIRQYY
ncbi:MAG: spermidine synthase [Patiriisocius sp.]|jgi:spermidine synthase